MSTEAEKLEDMLKSVSNIIAQVNSLFTGDEAAKAASSVSKELENLVSAYKQQAKRKVQENRTAYVKSTSSKIATAKRRYETSTRPVAPVRVEKEGVVIELPPEFSQIMAEVLLDLAQASSAVIDLGQYARDFRELYDYARSVKYILSTLADLIALKLWEIRGET